MGKFRGVWVAGAIAGAASSAWANTEPPPAYDARSVGMGSTGVAHVENGASLYHNPAALNGMAKGAVTGVIAPLAPQVTAPLEGPDSEVDSQRAVGPLFLVGGGYRVHDRVTVGAAVFPTMGFGATFEDVQALGGLNLSARLAVLEIAPGAAFAITDALAIGVAYRASHFSYGAETPAAAPPPAPAGTLLQAESNLNGWNFTGLHVGLHFRATPSTRLGLSYRSKISADLDGTTEMAGQEMDTSMEFTVPHILKVGVAQGLLDDRLTLAADLKYALFKDANEELVVATDVPGAGTVEQPLELDWKNSIGAYLGAEYRIEPAGPGIRAGYSVVSSATPEETAQPVMPPPGLHHAVHAGVGVEVHALALDLGGYYMFGGKRAEPNAEPPGSADGDYRFDAILVALSATYRFGESGSKDEQ